MDTYLIHFVYYSSFEHQSTDAPPDDKEWIKAYKIVPRVGDCVLKEGEWFQVERVFLYQSQSKGIDALAECSFYGRDKK